VLAGGVPKQPFTLLRTREAGDLSKSIPCPIAVSVQWLQLQSCSAPSQPQVPEHSQDGRASIGGAAAAAWQPQRQVSPAQLAHEQKSLIDWFMEHS
jgi:hypothetical protein